MLTPRAGTETDPAILLCVHGQVANYFLLRQRLDILMDRYPTDLIEVGEHGL
jgi:hypothetical protein